MHLKNVIPKKNSPLDQAEYTLKAEGITEQYVYPFLPGIRFFKLLAIRNPKNKLKNYLKIKINIVDTLVFNEKEMPLFLLRTNKEGVLTRMDINRNIDLINLFKQNPEFNHSDDLGKITKDLITESRNKNTNKKFILSNTRKEHLSTRLRKKTFMIGKILRGFSVSPQKKRPEVMKQYDKTFNIIRKERNRRHRFEKEPFVIVKRGSNQNNRVCNSSTILTERDFFDQCFGFLNSRDDMFVVQKYVHCNGSLHTLVRGCYSNEEGKSKCFVLSNKDKMNRTKSGNNMKSSKRFNY
jgi:hypothetical protein